MENSGILEQPRRTRLSEFARNGARSFDCPERLKVHAASRAGSAKVSSRKAPRLCGSGRVSTASATLAPCLQLSWLATSDMSVLPFFSRYGSVQLSTKAASSALV